MDNNDRYIDDLIVLGAAVIRIVIAPPLSTAISASLLAGRGYRAIQKRTNDYEEFE
jgi:hypothetical protein